MPINERDRRGDLKFDETLYGHHLVPVYSNVYKDSFGRPLRTISNWHHLQARAPFGLSLYTRRLMWNHQHIRHNHSTVIGISVCKLYGHNDSSTSSPSRIRSTTSSPLAHVTRRRSKAENHFQDIFNFFWFLVLCLNTTHMLRRKYFHFNHVTVSIPYRIISYYANYGKKQLSATI